MMYWLFKNLKIVILKFKITTIYLPYYCFDLAEKKNITWLRIKCKNVENFHFYLKKKYILFCVLNIKINRAQFYKTIKHPIL